MKLPNDRKRIRDMWIVWVLIGTIVAFITCNMASCYVYRNTRPAQPQGVSLPYVSPEPSVMPVKATEIDQPTEYAVICRVAKRCGLNAEQTAMLHVTRRIENGRAGLEFGVGDGIPDHPARRYAGDFWRSFELQATWSAGTIKKRYTGDIPAFARRYCPVNHRNWERMASRMLASN